MGYLYLAIAIAAEVVATGALKASDGFSKLGPSIVVVVGYGIAFFLFSLALKTLTVGVAYAIWAGMGIVLTAIVGVIVFKEIPDTPAVLGMALIVVGGLVINVFSKTATQ